MQGDVLKLAEIAKRDMTTIAMLENKRERLDSLATSISPTSVPRKLKEDVTEDSQMLVVSGTPAMTRIEAE